MNPRFFTLAVLAAVLCACGDTASPPEPSTDAAETAASGAAPVESPLVEPTEDEMEALEKAAIDALNANGGFAIEMSGVRSPPIRMKLDSFRKTGCKPYTKAFRCESEIGVSYPGTDFPAETLPSSHRYQKDDQGNWTRD